MKLVTALALGAAVAANGVFAQEESETAEAAETTKAPATAAKAAFKFSTLPYCVRTSGMAEVKLPLSEEWVAIEEGKFYPLGTAYRTGKVGDLVISFGKDCTVTIGGDSSFGTRAVSDIREMTRTVTLGYGTVEVSLARNLPEGVFVIAASSFSVRNPAGDSKFTCVGKGDGEEAIVRCVTGTMSVEGRHFTIPQMRAANEFRIRSDRDNLATMLYGMSGDYVVKLDQGLGETVEIDDEGKPKSKTEPRSLDWHLSPETRVFIDRAVASVGTRMSVHTMCFDPAGTMKSECSFCEGRAEINSGELVKAEKSEGDDAAKHASEATEESAATEESEEEEKSEGTESEEN